MPQAPTNVVAVTPGGALSEEHFLGFFFWYNVPEELKAGTTLRRAATNAGLPEDLLPKERQPFHVAQEAIRHVEGDRSNGVRRRVVVHEVVHTGAKLVYQVTLQIWDRENEAIEHEKSMRVTFDKVRGEFTAFDPLDAHAYSELRPLEEVIREYYAKHRSWLPGHKVRTIVRHYLEGLGAENMSDSGRSAVYYVTKDCEEDLKSVKEFLQVYDGKKGHTKGGLHMVPVVNDEGQREMLKRKFLENCEQDLAEYRDRLVKLVKDQGDRKRGFRADMLANIQQQRREFQERKARFEAVLNDTLGELDQSMGLADKALTKLLQEAEVA